MHGSKPKSCIDESRAFDAFKPNDLSFAKTATGPDGESPNRTGAWIMANLYEIPDNAHDGEALTALGREFGLMPAQTQAAVTALLPAISSGLKQSTATLDGLGKLFSMMGQQQDLHTMYDDPDMAFATEGRAAGNDALSVISGSPDVRRAVVDQAQRL